MTNKTSLLAALAVVASCKSDPPTTSEPTTKETVAMKPTVADVTTAKSAPPTKQGKVPVDGVDYHYEIHGSGEPLLLLHGGLMSSDGLRPLLPGFEGRQVILVDLQGHGRTNLGDRPITVTRGADDVAIILEKIGVPATDVAGYSFGGAIALRLAVQHPERVRRLAIISAPFEREGWYPEMLPQQAALSGEMAPMMKDSPMYQSYAAVAPKPEEFPRLLDRMGEWMGTPYNYADDVKKITQPTLIAFGDSDMVRIDHAVEFYKLLGGGQRDAGWQREHMAKNRLAIIPDATHYDILFSTQLVPTIRPFLDGKTGPASAQVSAR